jgi:hypothetical protein
VADQSTVSRFSTPRSGFERQTCWVSQVAVVCLRYNRAMTARRDDFPNNFVGDLVHTDRGWVVLCRRRAARSATTTATEAGRSARCGVPATIGTWRGGVPAAQCFTRHSPDRIAGFATAARCRCTKTSSGMRKSRRGQSFRCLAWGYRKVRNHCQTRVVHARHGCTFCVVG